jgi:hypothetical protein
MQRYQYRLGSDPTNVRRSRAGMRRIPICRLGDAVNDVLEFDPARRFALRIAEPQDSFGSITGDPLYAAQH